MSSKKSTIEFENLSKLFEIKMLEKKLKSYEVAHLAGVGRSFIYDILKGKSKNPSLSKLMKIGKVLDCSNELFEIYQVSPSKDVIQISINELLLLKVRLYKAVALETVQERMTEIDNIIKQLEVYNDK